MKNSPALLLSSVAGLAATGARFANFTYTAKGTGEVASHTVALGVSIEKAYKRDLAILETEKRRIYSTFISPFCAEMSVELQACEELIASLNKSLNEGIGNNPGYTCAGVYNPVCRGIKLHKETGEMHVTGFSIRKQVLEAGVHKNVKSSAKTIAKNKLRAKMKSGKFRQFSFSSLASARMNGKTLVFQ